MDLKTVAPKRRYQDTKGLSLKAFGDRIIVKLDEEGLDEHAFGESVTLKKDGNSVRTASGIYIPDNKKELAIRAALTGTVVHAGEAVTWVQPGDAILFGQYAGTNIEAIASSFCRHFVACVLAHPGIDSRLRSLPCASLLVRLSDF